MNLSYEKLHENNLNHKKKKSHIHLRNRPQNSSKHLLLSAHINKTRSKTQLPISEMRCYSHNSRKTICKPEREYILLLHKPENSHHAAEGYIRRYQVSSDLQILLRHFVSFYPSQSNNRRCKRTSRSLSLLFHYKSLLHPRFSLHQSLL